MVRKLMRRREPTPRYIYEGGGITARPSWPPPEPEPGSPGARRAYWLWRHLVFQLRRRLREAKREIRSQGCRQGYLRLIADTRLHLRAAKNSRRLSAHLAHPEFYREDGRRRFRLDPVVWLSP